MKIKEFIEKVNQNDRMEAEEIDGVVAICDDSDHEVIDIPCGATNLLEIDFAESYYRYNFGKPSREYLSALIEELLHTPIKERFPEKKWVLCLGKNDYGQKVYLTKTHTPRQIGTTMNADCFAEWSNQEIQDLIELFPKLAPSIAAMKEGAKNDEEQN